MRNVSLIALSVGVSLTALATPAVAQQAIGPNSPTGADAVQAQSDGIGEEIVVTAQKREERLQTTAITADVLTGAALEAKRIDNVQALQLSTPSLSLGEGGVTTAPNIRGIGLLVSSASVVSGVATYRDGLFQPPILASEPFFDMARIEVLRGPQGTFVGSSSTGGAIFYNTNNPTFDKIGGYIRAGYGNFDDLQAQGAINLPLSDTFAARFAFNVESRDSFFKQTGTVRRDNSHGQAFRTPGNLDQRNLRLTLEWRPNDQLTVISKTALNRNNTDGLAHILSPNSPYYDGRPVRYDLTYNLEDSEYNEKAIRQSVSVDWETDSGITFRSVSGYNDIRVEYVDDFDSSSSLGKTGLAPATGVFTNRVHEYIASQEFNILSPAGNRFDWVVGAFYFYDYALPAISIFNPTPPTTIILDSPSIKQALAGFGQIGYKIFPNFQIQAGVRYTQSYAEIKGATTLLGLAPVPIVIPQGAKERDGAWTGKIIVNWTVSPDQFLYAFVAKGAKAGGINGPTVPNFAPEKVFDYEVGLKSSWFGRHLRTQINGFYMDYSNLQLRGYIPPVGAVGGANGFINAGASTIYGVEAQAQATIGRLGLDANLSYVHSKLGNVRFIDSALLPGTGDIPLGPQCAAGVPSNPPTCFNYGPATATLSGNRNPYSPKITFNLGAQYKIPVRDGMTLTPRVDYNHIGEQFQSIQNSRVSYTDRIAAHDLVNLRLTLDSGPWQLEGYVTNLTDKTYISGFTYGPSLFLGRPRQYGFTVSRNF